MKMLRITLEGKTYDVAVELLDSNATASAIAPVAVPPVVAPAVAAPVAPVAGEKIVAPMAGILLKMRVKVGDAVKQGQEVAVLEAMKMETSILASTGGSVLSVAFADGTSVSEGQVLLTIG